ncbi:MAG: NUDIX domain-containing protein [Bacteroides sp.]|nr:NUDIX domain-containing protein [Bacteroides sp.]
MTKENTYYAEHAKFHVALDCIIFGFDEGELKLLIHKRKFEPFLGDWSLFGGFMKAEESLSEAANRILSELTGLQKIYMEELQTYGEMERDPAGRVLSVAYYALIPARHFSDDYSKQYGATWVSLNELPDLIMDHNLMVESALRRLRRRTASQPIGFELLPREFTIPQLQSLYEAIYQTSIDKRNFRKKIFSMDVLVKLEEKDKSSSRKGAFLYRFDKRKYGRLIEKGYNFTL